MRRPRRRRKHPRRKRPRLTRRLLTKSRRHLRTPPRTSSRARKPRERRLEPMTKLSRLTKKAISPKNKTRKMASHHQGPPQKKTILSQKKTWKRSKSCLMSRKPKLRASRRSLRSSSLRRTGRAKRSSSCESNTQSKLRRMRTP